MFKGRNHCSPGLLSSLHLAIAKSERRNQAARRETNWLRLVVSPGRKPFSPLPVCFSFCKDRAPKLDTPVNKRDLSTRESGEYWPTALIRKCLARPTRASPLELEVRGGLAEPAECVG
jgi:hypothetical protein